MPEETPIKTEPNSHDLPSGEIAALIRELLTGKPVTYKNYLILPAVDNKNNGLNQHPQILIKKEERLNLPQELREFRIYRG